MKNKNKIIALAALATFAFATFVVNFSKPEVFQGKISSFSPKVAEYNLHGVPVYSKTKPIIHFSPNKLFPDGNENPPSPPSSSPDPIENQSVSFQGPNGLMLTGRLYKPQGSGPFPAVVFMHGCSGLLTGANGNMGSEFTYWGSKMKNEENTVALFVDSFTARGITTVCGDGSILNEATERPKDAYAGLAYLRTLSYVQPQKVALMGWSNGGSAVLSSVAKNNNPAGPFPPQGGFAGAIVQYPGCGLRSHYGTDYSNVANLANGTWLPQVKTIILGGQNDQTTPPDPKCVNLVTRAQQLGASDATGNSVTLTIYPGAQHGFDRAQTGVNGWTQDDVTARDLGRNVIINNLRSFLD